MSTLARLDGLCKSSGTLGEAQGGPNCKCTCWRTLDFVDLAVVHSRMDRKKLCWELPFTNGGHLLVGKISPAAFLGSCDPVEMR